MAEKKDETLDLTKQLKELVSSAGNRVVEQAINSDDIIVKDGKIVRDPERKAKRAAFENTAGQIAQIASAMGGRPDAWPAQVGKFLQSNAQNSVYKRLVTGQGLSKSEAGIVTPEMIQAANESAFKKAQIRNQNIQAVKDVDGLTNERIKTAADVQGQLTSRMNAETSAAAEARNQVKDDRDAAKPVEVDMGTFKKFLKWDPESKEYVEQGQGAKDLPKIFSVKETGADNQPYEVTYEQKTGKDGKVTYTEVGKVISAEHLNAGRAGVRDNAQTTKDIRKIMLQDAIRTAVPNAPADQLNSLFADPFGTGANETRIIQYLGDEQYQQLQQDINEAAELVAQGVPMQQAIIQAKANNTGQPNPKSTGSGKSGQIGW